VQTETCEKNLKSKVQGKQATQSNEVARSERALDRAIRDLGLGKSKGLGQGLWQIKAFAKGQKTLQRQGK
jgi:hypothetical protein